MHPQMVLYAAPFSSATPVVHAFDELDVPHERVMLDLAQGKQRTPEFLALNPNGKVPTLVVDGTPMFEALAILQWLGDRYGVERGLWPAADDPARLVALSWTTWSYASFGPVLRCILWASSERVDAKLHHAPLADFARAELRGLLDVLEGRLADRPYVLGADYSLVDLVVGNVVFYAKHTGASLDDHARIAAWLERLQARPAFRSAWGPA
ncbi:MAG: glutathione S-transferase family protein [Sandaracinaceae bacterium]|nr:glutathione S-transferase family protein [Sandaracinaceae bacterium]